MEQYNDEPQARESFRGKTQRPADVLRDGALKATIWENQGDKGPYFTATLAKTYEDRNGKLKDTHSFSGMDLLRVSELARQAYTRSNDLRREAQHRTNRVQGVDDNHTLDLNDGQRERRDDYRSQRQSHGQSQGQRQAHRDDTSSERTSPQLREPPPSYNR